jgi:hypothetical protein
MRASRAIDAGHRQPIPATGAPPGGGTSWTPNVAEALVLRSWMSSMAHPCLPSRRKTSPSTARLCPPRSAGVAGRDDPGVKGAGLAAVSSPCRRTRSQRSKSLPRQRCATETCCPAGALRLCRQDAFFAEKKLSSCGWLPKFLAKTGTPLPGGGGSGVAGGFVSEASEFRHNGRKFRHAGDETRRAP